MLRYNHRIIERKWRETWSKKQSLSKKTKIASAFLIPKNDQQFNLENARILVLTDFFAATLWKEDYFIYASGCPSFLAKADQLGIFVAPQMQDDSNYDLAVIPRDFNTHLHRTDLTIRKQFVCGRLLDAMDAEELLSDFGGDALRIYFLFLGPPERDYTFNWHALVSAHRFVQKVWRLGQACTLEILHPFEANALEELTLLVESRVAKKSPHTALAAIMGYLKPKQTLKAAEVIKVAELLKPFTPFLSAELTNLVATIQGNNNGESN